MVCRKWMALWVAGCLTTGTGQAALVPGYAVLGTEHVDLGVAYEDGAWDLHLHDDDNDIEYGPNEALSYASPGTKVSRPAGAQWDFIGVGAGEDLWLLPQVQDPSLLWLGIGGEELQSGIFTENTVTLSLTDVRVPGEFSLFANSVFGAPILLMATSDGISAADAVDVFAGSHAHYNWTFSAPGYYEIDFEASGILLDGNEFTSSGPVTFYFGVETTAVPEASSLALLGLAGGSFVGLHRLRRSRSTRPLNGKRS